MGVVGGKAKQDGESDADANLMVTGEAWAAPRRSALILPRSLRFDARPKTLPPVDPSLIHEACRLRNVYHVQAAR